MIAHYPDKVSLRIALMFICRICDSNFDDYFSALIPNTVISEGDFAELLAEKIGSFLELKADEISN